MSIISRFLSPVQPIAGVPDPLIQRSTSHINLDVSVGAKKSTCPEQDSSSLPATSTPNILSLFLIHHDLQQLTRIQPGLLCTLFLYSFPFFPFPLNYLSPGPKFPCLDSPLSFLIVLTPASIPCKPRSTLRPESTYLHIRSCFFPHLKPLMSFEISQDQMQTL